MKQLKDDIGDYLFILGMSIVDGLSTGVVLYIASIFI